MSVCVCVGKREVGAEGQTDAVKCPYRGLHSDSYGKNIYGVFVLVVLSTVKLLHSYSQPLGLIENGEDRY